MPKDALRQSANLLSVILTLTIHVLASVLTLNGLNTTEVQLALQHLWLGCFG